MMARVRGVIECSMASKSIRKLSVAGDEAVGYCLGAEELDLGLVDRKAGVGVEHLVAGVHQAKEELLDDGLAAGLHGNVFGAAGMPCVREISWASASRNGRTPPFGQ